MNYRTVFFGLLISILFSCNEKQKEDSSELVKPNIVIIYFDDLGYVMSVPMNQGHSPHPI